MEDMALYDSLRRELDASFSGWDFSRIVAAGRMQESVLPWNYRSIAAKYSARKECLLDMGTGGGEFLDSLDFLPARTYATEGYPPNVPIATERLSGKGIVVKAVEDEGELPFEDSFFDVILNRHEAYSAKELKRVLAKGGAFVTQQVGGLNALDLSVDLGADSPGPYFGHCLAKDIEELRGRGMEIIEFDEHIGSYRFFDIGAVAYYLKCVPWQFPDFSLDGCFPRLRILAQIIEKRGSIDFIDHRFYLVARA